MNLTVHKQFVSKTQVILSLDLEVLQKFRSTGVRLANPHQLCIEKVGSDPSLS